MFPQAIGMAAAFDEEAMERVGDIIATEGRAKYNEYSKHDDRDIYKGLTFWSPNVIFSVTKNGAEDMRHTERTRI